MGHHLSIGRRDAILAAFTTHQKYRIFRRMAQFRLCVVWRKVTSSGICFATSLGGASIFKSLGAGTGGGPEFFIIPKIRIPNSSVGVQIAA